ncbi:deoxyribodipyrimidine photolyase [Acuticoccus sediminis]|uniref:Deoxyribodipyrimidine photo-lyase n=1 Tax=Acuticoccus sediminis TaxID=2184697 RepID=A0A8B2NTG2_9HYPH|nr:deoxyribodipyrimidine photo-lyase [Acuticoccus sediminis]RAI00473.1 deoxyribodipyrimidine photolyase [Acuticoccus sediminis]
MDAHARRSAALNDRAPRKEAKLILYWMQHSQRAHGNPALERAAYWANQCGLPLLVLFVVDPGYPDANIRHYTFMLEGLKETIAAVEKRGAAFSLRLGSPPEVAVKVAREAAVVVTDRGYLRHLVEWRRTLARECDCLVEMVEGDAIVPVEEASGKQETAARTFRPRVHRALPAFLDLPQTVRLKHEAKDLGSKDDQHLTDVTAFAEGLGCDMSVPAVTQIRGGISEARKHLKAFLQDDFPYYGDKRLDIINRHVSVMSPYLHFGQISPLEIYHAVQDVKGHDESRASYVEEMLVRRELAINFVHYSPEYDSYKALPVWARETLEHHAGDPRDRTFTRRQLEEGKTDDPYWNAAMREMRVTGYLHNALRMYWGKRIIAYTNTPKTAYATALYLNNKYFLDGRDANSYANVGWLFGLHDRGWPERNVFGKVRTMTASGLERKFDIDACVKWANAL